MLYIFTLSHRIKYCKSWGCNKGAAVNFTFFWCIMPDVALWLAETCSGLYLKRICVKSGGLVLVSETQRGLMTWIF